MNPEASPLERIQAKKAQLDAVEPFADPEARQARLAELDTQLAELQVKIAEHEAEKAQLEAIQPSALKALFGQGMKPEVRDALLTDEVAALDEAQGKMTQLSGDQLAASTLPTEEELGRQKALADRLLTLATDRSEQASSKLGTALKSQDGQVPALKAQALREAEAGSKHYIAEAPARRRLAIREQLELPTDPDTAFPDAILDAIIGETTGADSERTITEAQIQEIRRQQASFQLATEMAQRSGVTLDLQNYCTAATFPIHGSWKGYTDQRTGQTFTTYFHGDSLGESSINSLRPRLSVTDAIQRFQNGAFHNPKVQSADLPPYIIGMAAELLEPNLYIQTEGIIISLAEVLFQDTTGSVIGSRAFARDLSRAKLEHKIDRRTFDDTCREILQGGVGIKKGEIPSRPLDLRIALSLAQALSIVQSIQKANEFRVQNGKQTFPDSIRLRTDGYEFLITGDSTIESLQAHYQNLLDRDAKPEMSTTN